MKSFIKPMKKLIPTTLVATVAAAGSLLLPLAAHADGDSDRQENAAFYQNLDQRESGPAPAAATASRQPKLRSSARMTHSSVHVGYISPARRQQQQSPSRVIVTATAPAESESSEGDGYFVHNANAEATGAAEGQTVRRATNSL